MWNTSEIRNEIENSYGIRVQAEYMLYVKEHLKIFQDEYSWDHQCANSLEERGVFLKFYW